MDTVDAVKTGIYFFLTLCSSYAIATPPTIALSAMHQQHQLSITNGRMSIGGSSIISASILQHQEGRKSIVQTAHLCLDVTSDNEDNRLTPNNSALHLNDEKNVSSTATISIITA